MEWRSVGKVVTLAIAVPTTAILLYWLLIRKDEDDDNDQTMQSVNTSRQTVIQMAVPSKAVGTVIGPKGATIKKLQKESGAQVNFSDRDRDCNSEEDRTAMIRGDTESAQRAEVMIRQIIADMPTIVTEEVLVPVHCVGQIIGRGGDTIRSISRSTQCKIFIDRSQDKHGPEVPRVITITGPEAQIPFAKALIEEKVLEEQQFRNKTAVKGDNGEERKRVTMVSQDGKEKVELPSRVVEPEMPEKSWDCGDDLGGKIPAAEPVREFMQVFVSAVEHPGHFWLQAVNTTALSLDKMTDDMTAFYNNSENTQTYSLQEVKVGDVVAAPFSHDGSWYRATVDALVDGKADLYYFDFGDNCLLPLDELRELKPEYLSLPVQAIECSLANVQPTGEAWPNESIDAFEELVHCAEWKILSAKTVGYASGSSGPQPCVQLIDIATGQPVDVAKELVKRGLAAWDPSPSSTPTTTTATVAATPAVPATVRPESVPDPNPS